MPDAARAGERVLRGIPVSPGVCRGKIFVLHQRQAGAIARQQLTEADVPPQLQRLQQALVATRDEILDVQRQVTAGIGAKDASIFDAHLLVLEDPTLLQEVTRIIAEQRVPAEFAFQQVAEKYTAALAAI